MRGDRDGHERYARLARHLGLAASPAASAAPAHGDEAGQFEGRVFVEYLGAAHQPTAAQAPPQLAHQFETVVIWLHDSPMLPGRPYLVRAGAALVRGTLSEPKYRVEVDTLDHLAARTLARDEIGVCNLLLDAPIEFSPYAENPAAGEFGIVDGVSGEGVGAGLIHFALRRSQNIHPQALDVDKRARAELKHHRPCVIWLTGLSGAGKSTIANQVESRLLALRCHTYLLDGDNLRHGLNRDLGFTDADRVENIRRIGELARLMVDAGLIVLCAFISPFRAERRLARSLVEKGEFIEVFVDTPLETAERRDPKGLYKKARRGDLKNFTGIDSPYEPPEHPELHLRGDQLGAEQAADRIIELLRSRGMLPRD